MLSAKETDDIVDWREAVFTAADAEAFSAPTYPGDVPECWEVLSTSKLADRSEALSA